MLGYNYLVLTLSGREASCIHANLAINLDLTPGRFSLQISLLVAKS